MSSATDISDISLIEKTKTGNNNAFSILVKRHESAVRAYLRVRMNNIHEAEDLAQETFIVAYDKLSHFQMNASFSAWLRGIATNLLRNHQRKHAPVAVGGNNELETLINQQIEQRFHAEQESALTAHLKYCLNKLDEKMRTLLTEHFTLGYSLSELCKKYGDRHSTMTMRMYRLRQKLKTCIENRTNT
ncbi:RNA polymerase sigma factor [Agaribacter marinus]|uniref:RNA polymerase sigma factor n=1 Tax=Agaribacter marinus TaxID=1431249 RepID=A0AA37T170_9ALTE|nr:sigma-70 family RNA polymerase sigma factor [Agaribacter marinus]GLR71850.1 RNA polymerase sigma factor [Agaribacter marinus]